jgi:hypothetical protein
MKKSSTRKNQGSGSISKGCRNSNTQTHVDPVESRLALTLAPQTPSPFIVTKKLAVG